MDTAELITLIAVGALIILVLVWAYRKRRRLVNHAQFTAETCFQYFQTQDKQEAIDAVQYQREEKEEDEAGEKKKP